MLSLGLMTGCASTFRAGQDPPVDKLTQLRPGSSTAAEVVALMGEPQGKGRAAMTSLSVQDIWAYQFVEAETGSKSRSRVLILFMDERSGVYSGHLWFRSGQILGVKS
jgi:hypothetical protein